MVQADLFPPLQLTPGDVVLICSDGLTDMLADAEIARLVSNNAPKRAAQRLIMAANKRGGFDNISVAIARVGGKVPPLAGGGLLESIGRLPRRQKTILLVGAILVAAALCALATTGWRMYGAGRRTPTSTPVPTATGETVPTATVPAVVTTTLQTTDTVSPGHPTSTPRPTNTPTNTPRPSTLTLTPVPPTHTPIPPTQPPGPGPGPKPTKPPDTPPPR